MKKVIITLFVSGLVLSSCVTKKQYAALQSKLDKSEREKESCDRDVNTLKSEVASLMAKIDGLRGLNAADKESIKTLKSTLEQCMNAQKSGNMNVSKLIEQIDDSNKYIKQLINSKNTNDSLALVLTNNLTRSLSRDEMEDVNVQVKKAVVFISLSDKMLYKSGSYEITSEADAVLAKIAKIIKDYPTYDVMVEGNTDDVPISQKNIRNNWDLSALRASSVVQALQNKHGVEPKRMTAGGRGQYNPLGNNSTEEEKAKNRRTEIIILPNLDQFMDLVGKGPSSK